MKILRKERDDSTVKCNQALKERDLALEELNNFGAELKEVQNDLAKCQAEFELGKKVWTDERIALTDRLKRQFDKGQENSYCQGYLDGWFNDPHVYVLASLEAN